MPLRLLLLFCGAALTLSTTSVRRAGHGHHIQRSKMQQHLGHKIKRHTIRRNKMRHKKFVPYPGMSSAVTDTDLNEFGLHIHGRKGVLITGKELQKDWVEEGCGDDHSRCKCAYTKNPKTNIYEFKMKGKQSDSSWGFYYKLKFSCKGVTFRLIERGVTCKCDFKVQVNQGGWKRVFEDNCKPQYCLTKFNIFGGGGPKTNTLLGPLTGPWIEPHTKIGYWSRCDADHESCPSWASFKTAFENADGLSSDRWKYGTQGTGNTLDQITKGGRKWYYGLVFEPLAISHQEKEDNANLITGLWVPMSSGGQASFSASMHWDASHEKATSDEVSTSLALSVQASYGAVSVGAEASHGWASSAAQTNSDTKGGEKSKTCAAYQCEGGTTWQWKMAYLTAKFKTTFDNCIFVCTPNQGVFPKCPFGSCCSAENRNNECSTCSTLWCNPEDIKCPLNPAHDEYAQYCGVTDDVYIDFLKIVRSRVVVWSRVTEQQDYNFKRLQERDDIDDRALRMLQKSFRKFQYAKGIIEGVRSCIPGPLGQASAKEKCPLCDVGIKGCDGDPTGVALGTKDDSSKLGNNWCQKNCVLAKKNSKLTDATARVKNRVKFELGNMTIKVMEEELAEYKQYVYLAHDQASNFDYEAGLRQLKACDGRRTAKKGDPLWCLCNSKGRKIKWAAGDEGDKTKEADSNAKDKKKDDEEPKPSVCSNAGDKVRSKQCKWQGDEINGSCCSKQSDGKLVCAKQPAAEDHYERENMLIGEVDLGPDDFSLEQLRRANERLRLECFYNAETEAQTRDRIRRGKYLKPKETKDENTKEAGKKDANAKEAGKKDANAKEAGKKDENDKEAGKKDENDKEEKQRVLDKERDNLFLCFRKYFRDNEKKKFSLQKLDSLLVAETASCEDRLVNKKCVKKHPVSPSKDALSLGDGGGGSSDGGAGGGTDADASGADADAGDAEDDGRVCCAVSGKPAKMMDKEDCKYDEGGKSVSKKQCIKEEDKKDDDEKKDEKKKKDGDEKEENEEKKKDGDEKEEKKKDGDEKEEEKKSLTAEADNVQKGKSEESDKTQDGKKFEKEQKDAEDGRNEGANKKKCCQSKGSSKLYMANKCNHPATPVSMQKCIKQQEK